MKLILIFLQIRCCNGFAGLLSLHVEYDALTYQVFNREVFDILPKLVMMIRHLDMSPAMRAERADAFNVPVLVHAALAFNRIGKVLLSVVVKRMAETDNLFFFKVHKSASYLFIATPS